MRGREREGGLTGEREGGAFLKKIKKVFILNLINGFI